MPRPYRYLPAPKELRRIRLDVEAADAARVEGIAASLGLTLAGFARLVVEMTGRNGPPTLASVKAEADRRRGPVPSPPPKRPRGRPRRPAPQPPA